MIRFAMILLLAVAAPIAAQAQEQGKNGDQSATEHRPPPGMCRIWINGVPAERQPAPTDCATAMRRRPSNARVIFGDEVRSTGVARPPKQFTEPPKFTEAPKFTEPPKSTEPQSNQQPNQPPNEPKPNEPRPNEPRQVEPNTNDPHPPPPRAQPRPPVRLPPRPVAKPHKPGGPPMSRIRIH